MIKREPGTVDPSEYNWKDHFALEGIIEPFIKMDVGKVRGLAIAVEELQAENERLRDIQGLLINWMERHKTDTSYPHKPTQQTYWEQIVSEYPYLAEVDDEMPRS